MAYVPLQYPSVLYSAAGVPQPAANAAQAAALPAGYAASPLVQAPVLVAAVDSQLAATSTIPEQLVAGQGVVLIQDAGGVPTVVSAAGPIPLLQ